LKELLVTVHSTGNKIVFQLRCSEGKVSERKNLAKPAGSIQHDRKGIEIIPGNFKYPHPKQIKIIYSEHCAK
jgi:hypothetical protein